MRKIRLKLSTISFLVCLILVTIFGTVNVKAEPVTGSLTLKKALPGSSFTLYQIQTKEADGSYTTTEAFSGYAIDLNLKTSEDMRAAATTLRSYIIADKPKAYDKKTADKKGEIVFDNLPFGLYLAIGDDIKVNGEKRQQVPVMAYLPASKNQRPVYDLSVDVKTGPADNRTAYEVCKVWKNDNGTSRPTQIKVSLYKDGKKFETVTLSKTNGWKYKWENLKPGSYTVVEETKLKDYSVSITQESGVFTVRNTKSKTPPPPPGIPQTGQLWWPVIVLLILGISFLVIGIKGKKKHK